MSAFSDVDGAGDPRRLVECLEASARGLGAMKQYMATAQALQEPDAAVLDLGCGAGHDLRLLERVGVRGVGIDPSAVMVGAAASRTRLPLARGRGEELPFRDGAFAGCRVERGLMHVAEPTAVLAEVVRCVRPGGLLTIFEPDWSCLAVNGERVPLGWLTVARHPAIGATAGDLLRHASCVIHDRVEERSWWTYDEFERNTNLEASLNRAVALGTLTKSRASLWLAHIRERAARDDFTAVMVKVLWVGSTPNRRRVSVGAGERNGVGTNAAVGCVRPDTSSSCPPAPLLDRHEPCDPRFSLKPQIRR
jgi:SAM-dependent methyltransferase